MASRSGIAPDASPAASLVLIRSSRAGTTKFIETLALGRSEPRVSVVLIRGASPGSQGLLQRWTRVLGTSRIEEPPPFLGQTFESDGVYLVVRHAQQISTASCLDHIPPCSRRATRLKCSPESGDVGTERLLSGPRRVLAPHLLEKLIGRHDLASVRSSDRRARSVLAGYLHRLATVLGDLQRTEDEETHGWSVRRGSERG